MANTITKSPTLRKTRIVCISDTHGASPKDGAFKLPKGDVLIHAGDLTNQGGHAEMKKTIDWIASSDYEVKIVVAGNHDLTLSPSSPTSTLPLLPPSIHHLTHQPSLVRLSSPTGSHTSFRLFASPHSPLLSSSHGAFTYTPRQADEIWSTIPLDTDVVVTHTPMKGHLDLHPKRGRVGCEALRRRMGEVRPALVVGGHVHEGRGGEVIRWKSGAGGQGGVGGMEEGTRCWEDPAAGRGGRGESRLDLTGREGRRETCVVNAAIMARSHGMGAKRYNQPIVVEIDLPVWGEGEEDDGSEEEEVQQDEGDGGGAGGKDIMNVDVG
ncbi:Metallo-dependent phosphatase-like protein [Elsinoe ampelina]|uniref:Metallo-dependent phosphatase-like protein n=1 Tax=Elsinoe ampelina TaxID=302913 RepID=A0A6A6G278_9PEZI|nr:Metallo-dependent phosphatase-like protein [Elsinoe ampelina]